MRTSALFDAETCEFFEIHVCPHGQGGWASAVIFRIRKGERGSVFHDFVRTFFMDGP